MRACVGLTLLLFAAAASSVSLLIDQDSVLPWLGPWGGDQKYTMGLALQVTGDWVKRSWVSRPLGWVDGFTGLAHPLHAALQGGVISTDGREGA